MVGRVVLLLAAIFVCCAWVDAQVLYAPVPPRPSGSNDVVALFLQNPLNVSISSQYITFGHPFYKTQLTMPANTSIMTAYFTDSKETIEVQVDAKAFHGDGSVRQATLSLLHPSIPANSSLTLMLTRSLRATTPLPVSQIPASVVKVTLQTFNDYASEMASSVNSTFNFDVKQLINAAESQDYWLQGEIAVQTRVTAWVVSSMRMVFDTTLYKDKSWCVDVIYTNDIAMSPIGGTLIYDTTITPLAGSPIVYNNLTNYQFQGFHKVVCSAGISQVNVQYDQLNMIQATAIFPVNYTIGLNLRVLTTMRATMKKADYGTPFNPNGVTQGMPNTGDRWDIGALPNPMAAWFVSQEADARQYVMGWSDASHSCPWNYYVNKTGRYLNYLDYPRLWIDSRGTIKPPQIGGRANGWTLDTSHTPSLNQVAYVISGARYNLDLLNGAVSWKIMSNWDAYRTNYGKIEYGLVCVGVQLRSCGWSLRDVGWAAWLNPTGSFESYYFNLTIATNLDFIMTNQTPGWQQTFGEIYGFFPLPYGSTGTQHPPWQDDYTLSSLAMLAMQGYERAADVMLWMRNFMVIGGITNAWNRNNRMAYNIYIGINETVKCNTWKCMQDQMVLKEVDIVNVKSVGGDYGQLARESFVMYQIVFPQDPDAAAARTWIDGAGVTYVDTATFRSDPKFNPGNFPMAIPLNYTFTPSTPMPTTIPVSTTATSVPGSTTATPGSTSETTTSGNSEKGAAASLLPMPIFLLAIYFAALYML